MLPVDYGNPWGSILPFYGKLMSHHIAKYFIAKVELRQNDSLVTVMSHYRKRANWTAGELFQKKSEEK